MGPGWASRSERSEAQGGPAHRSRQSGLPELSGRRGGNRRSSRATMSRSDPNAHRVYSCARCHERVRICQSCDRGQAYCSPECSAAMRRERQRQAARRYRATVDGRQRNAERQRRHRARQRLPIAVTHHGDTAADSSRSEDAASVGVDFAAVAPAESPLTCCRCRRRVTKWVRFESLRDLQRRPAARRSHRNRRDRGPR